MRPSGERDVTETKTDYRVIPIAELRRDGTQTRAHVSAERVAQYAERARAGESFPAPVAFWDGALYWLSDGFHRVAAYESSGFENVECDVRRGTKADAILHGIAANVGHDRAGMPRTNADKRRAVQMAIAALAEKAATWPDARLAEHCGVSMPTVAHVREQLALFEGEGDGANDEANAARAQELAIKAIDRLVSGLAKKCARVELAKHLRAWADRLEADGGR